jgi:hypothetical protein
MRRTRIRVDDTRDTLRLEGCARVGTVLETFGGRFADAGIHNRERSGDVR